MRNISFSLTEAQFQEGSKTVTRRLGWAFLKPGDRLMGVRKAMGLKHGEKIHRLGEIEVVSRRRESLSQIDHLDCAREGFPDFDPVDFVGMFCKHMRCKPETKVTRIEFKRIPAEDA